MKKLLFLSITFFLAHHLLAQDVIIFKNGDEVKAKVTEVGTTEIKYHKFENLAGPLYTIAKKDIFMIKYENGTKDVITDLSVKQGMTDGTAYKHRSPGLAFLFSFLLPGGGQYYNKQYVKGGVMTGLWFASIVTIGAASASDFYNECYYTGNGTLVCPGYDDYEAHPAAVVGGAVLAGTWIWSVIDAPVSAAMLNRKNSNGLGLLEFEKKDKFALQIEPFRAPGLGGSLTMQF